MLLLAAIGGCSAESKSCTTMGCMNGASIAVPVETDFTNIIGSTLEVCRNDVCVTGTYADIAEPTTSSSSATIELPDPATRAAKEPWATATVWKTETGYRLDIYYNVYGPNDVTNGDHYHVRLVATSGAVLADVEKTVTYQSLYPNGPDCDPEPCHWVGIKF
jgi:hypothetical protein